MSSCSPPDGSPGPSRGHAVSRETATRELFGDHGALADRYAEHLRTEGILRGLIGPREADKLWDRHLLNCAAIAPAIPRDAALVDVGSGAGLPGIALAIARPDLRVTLVEPLLRRVRYLEEVVAFLGLDRVEVVRGRAPNVVRLPGHGAFDVVTARAVAGLDRLVPWCLPLARPGGLVLALKGEQAEAELAAVAGTLAAQGVASWSVAVYGTGLVDPPTRVVRLVRATG